MSAAHITQPLLEVRHLTKSFSGIKALDGVQFVLHAGEVHALMGENGAGKSTLMKILMGLLTADTGEIFFEGKKLQNNNVHDTLKKGISMVHQEILAVANLTIAQNIFLGRETHRYFWLNDIYLHQQAQTLLSALGLSLTPTTLMKDLSVAQQQMVEIAKALSNQAKVIIMDEPTSALSDKEVEALFGMIQKLKAQGVGIVYISHKIEEIYTLADRITVLRDGQYITTRPKDQLPQNELISLMVGRQIQALYPPKVPVVSPKTSPVLSVKNLSKKGRFEDICFEVFAGEILGMAGLMGAGRTEVARAIYGLDSFDGGEIWIQQQKTNIKSPKEAIRWGIGYVSEDRKSWGFVPKMSVKHNLTLTQTPHQKGWIRESQEEKIAQKTMTELHIKASSSTQEVRFLSGGNQQKVIIGKALMANPKILILDEPTRGVDVGAKFEIYKLIHQLKNNGLAVILISSELPEILEMSDRILVMSEGKQMALLHANEVTQETIMHYAIH
ncbi:MAG: sugar ABC transporter ATP-binding protein [Runella sp.]